MICILHGYLLEGSGSNLWTRAIVQSLCQDGKTVHLVCQENHPQIHEFIAAAYTYERDGAVTTVVERDTPYPGRCIMHKPRLGDTLPVYVPVPGQYEEFPNVVPMVELPDEAIESYLSRNVAVVGRVVRENSVSAIHANHAVLMSVVAERVSATTGVPFAIMPHGSAIEYVVKKDQRFHALASGAFREAVRIFAIGRDMRRRILDTFPDLPDIEHKLEELDLGVDTGLFEPVARDARRARILKLCDALKTLEPGKQSEAARHLRARIRADIGREALTAAIDEVRIYKENLPDAGVEEKLTSIDWQQDELLLFVGRLIASKGLQSIVAALPRIFEAHHGARLIVVGNGPLREVMEAFLWALEHGEYGLARNIVTWGTALEGGEATPFEAVRLFFAELDARGELEGYFETARRVIRPERVIFTGYLTHRELKYLFPCCDVAIFPSIVAEAGPLVFLEALASGCFPLGTYFAGMAQSIDSVAGSLPPGDVALMKLRNDPSRTVADIVANTTGALALAGVHKETLRRVVVERYDSLSVARKLAAQLSSMTR